MPQYLSPLRWFGGKHVLSKKILPFPNHKIYVEPFCGSCAILLNKVPAPYAEVANDINNRLVNFWQIVRSEYYNLQLLCNLKGSIDSRQLFEKYKEHAEDSLEDAMRFFYVNRHSYSGKNDTYGGISSVGGRDKHKYYLHKIRELEIIYDRIKLVKFENQDFRKLLPRFDETHILWYLDPPYFNGGSDFEKGVGGVKWCKKDHEDLYTILLNANAKFVLSIDNREFYHNDNWFYEEIERYNSAASCKTERSKDTEWIIRNFDPNSVDVMTSHNQQSICDYIQKKKGEI
jgi:DNA adenine methylase